MVTHVDQISTPPTPADPPSVFEERAAQVWSDLARNVPQMNQQADEIEAIGQAADEARQAAQSDSDAALGYRNEANHANASAQSAAVIAGTGRDGAEDAKRAAEEAADRALTAAADAENRVPMTSATGAALLPEGDDTQRPAPGSIPAGVLPMRGSAQDQADYRAEFWDRMDAAWKVIADRAWVDKQIGFAIIYPSGGTAVAPASVVANTRYVASNPFPGCQVVCIAEIKPIGFGWGETGWAQNYGVSASLSGDDVVVQTGGVGILGYSSPTGNAFGIESGALPASAPCRVKVYKVKG